MGTDELCNHVGVLSACVHVVLRYVAASAESKEAGLG